MPGRAWLHIFRCLSAIPGEETDLKPMLRLVTALMLLCLLVPGSWAQAKNPYTLNLQEQPLQHPQPDCQYLMTPDVMDAQTAYDLIKAHLSSSHAGQHEVIRTDGDAFQFGYDSKYQTAWQNPEFLYLPLLRDLESDETILQISRQALTQLEWAAEPRLHTAISLSDVLQIMGEDEVLKEKTVWLQHGNSDPEVMFVVYQQTLEGLPLALNLENQSEQHFHRNLAGFTLDREGRLISGSIRHPWIIVEKSPLPAPIKSWQEAHQDLQDHFRQHLPPQGEYEFLDKDRQPVKASLKGEVVKISPCFVVHKLENGNYLALPAWSFLIHGWEQYQHVDRLVTSEGYFVLTVNAVTGEVS